MRSILLDELRFNEITEIEKYLKFHTTPSQIEGLYWLLLPEDILSNFQKELLSGSGPFKAAIEIGKNWLKFELLIRSSSIDNIGSGLANQSQFIYIYEFVDKLTKTLNLSSCM
jgi:hypothetical protein